MRNQAILKVENIHHKDLTSQNNVVHVAHGKPFTTSLVIAENCKIQHKNAIKLIRKYQPDFQEFGLLAFQTRARLKGQHGGGNTEIALLNEDQATYLITMFKNTDIVRKFKLTLVKEFRKVVTELQRIKSEPDRAAVMGNKHFSQQVMMDALKFARDKAGKETNQHHYTNENRLCNYALTGKFDRLEESTLDSFDAKLLTEIRLHNAKLIPYHLDYKERKLMLETFVSENKKPLLAIDGTLIEA